MRKVEVTLPFSSYHHQSVVSFFFFFLKRQKLFLYKELYKISKLTRHAAIRRMLPDPLGSPLLERNTS